MTPTPLTTARRMPVSTPLKWCLLAALLACVATVRAAQPKSYDRHFILVVDQTPLHQGNKMTLYVALMHWLNGDMVNASRSLKNSESFLTEVPPFNPERDQLSLFAFGLAGAGVRMNADYGRIHDNALYQKQSPENVFNDLKRSLIHPRHDFRSWPEQDFSQFMQNGVRALFDGSDPLFLQIQEASCISMSHYVYPLILNFIDPEVTAKQYIILMLSDFVSGADNKGDSEDRERLTQLLGGRSDYVGYFMRTIARLGMPFQQMELCKMVASDGNVKADVQLSASLLVVKEALQNAPLFITSNVTMRQTGGSRFQIGKTVVSFNKDRSTSIDSLEVVVSSDDGRIRVAQLISLDDAPFDEVRREYTIAQQAVDLQTEDFDFDCLNVDYNFYTTSKSPEGADLLPFLMTASRQIQYSDISFIKTKERTAMLITGSILLLLALVAIAIWRGKKKKVEPLKATDYLEEYVNVTPEKGAVRQSCLFYVRDQKPAPIPVRGRVRGLHSFFAWPWKAQAYAYVDDSELPVDGIRYCINNDPANLGQYVPIELESDGSFRFNIDLYIDPQTDLSQVLDMKIDIAVAVKTSFMGLGLPKDEAANHELRRITFRHYLIEDIGHAWIGIDPGTTGSCVALSGDPEANVANIEIQMVEAKLGLGTTKIIPSRLALGNADIADKAISDMQPGTDYDYGVQADQTWAMHVNSGHNCYQSVKKLLGYKKADSDRIVARFAGDRERAFTGVELAHLLVKGLQRDLDGYIDSLTPVQRRKLMPDGKKPRRAVVAIPNNYTLAKTLDMVDSVRMLGTYQEVRFIYEAEGVLFHYLHKTYGQKKEGAENIMVYDMGGATINCSVFRVEYYMDDERTLRFRVKTLARIGYGIGGDTIDVALLETLFTMRELGSMKLRTDVQLRHDYEAAHKTRFLSDIFDFKKDLINHFAGNGKPKERIDNEGNFLEFVNKFMQTPMTSGSFETKNEKDLRAAADAAADPDEREAKIKQLNSAFSRRIAGRFVTESEEQTRYVYNNITDAVREVMRFRGVTSIDRVIFSGRSTLFPLVKQTVLNAINSSNRKQDKSAGKKSYELEWKGMEGEEEIKTAVASGACWYGQCGLVELDNSLINGAYGFKLTEEGRAQLHVVLSSELSFTGDQPLTDDEAIVSSFAGDNHNICFYQVMGNGDDTNIFAPENRHKLNYLGAIHAKNKTSSISLEVDRKNKVRAEVTFESGHQQPLEVEAADHDLVHENDWPYIFATLTEDQEVAQEPVVLSGGSSTADGGNTTGGEDGGKRSTRGRRR